jgi:hypothetical protein
MRSILHLAALGAVATLLCPAPALARRPAPPPLAQGEALPSVGFRVLVEPEVLVTPRGRLFTRALVWKLREVFRSPGGYEVYAPVEGRGLADSRVVIKRPWQRGDLAMASHLFRHRDKAIKRFSRVSGSPEVGRIGRKARPLSLEAPVVAEQPPPPPAWVRSKQAVEAGPIWSNHDAKAKCPGVCGGPKRWNGQWWTTRPGQMSVCECIVAQPVVFTPPPPAPPAPPARDCTSVLLEKGYHANQLDNCKGVDQACAVMVLDKGHHPMQLSNCRGRLDHACTRRLLDKGYHPNQLSHCGGDISKPCALTLLDKGHHPMQLDNCRGVEDRCAVQLLNAGQHPMQLSHCRR